MGGGLGLGLGISLGMSGTVNADGSFGLGNDRLQAGSRIGGLVSWGQAELEWVLAHPRCSSGVNAAWPLELQWLHCPLEEAGSDD